MKYNFKKSQEEPFLRSKNNNIVEINEEFINLTGYSKDEVIGKSLDEMSIMLRMDSQVCFDNIETEYSCYIFTKELEPIEITITCNILESERKKIYRLKEKPNSRIQENYGYVDQIYNDNVIAVSIFSFPELILLKGNQKYLDCMDTPYDKKEISIGKNIKEIITAYDRSDLENCIASNIKVGNSHYETEVRHEHLKRGVIYIDVSIVPICIEGKPKFIVGTAVDVTEKVVNRNLLYKKAKVIKEQKKELEGIIENMSDGLYTVDKNLNLTLMNSSSKEFMYELDSFNKDNRLNRTKYYNSDGDLITSDNSPKLKVLKGEKFTDYRYTTSGSNGIQHFSLSGSPICDKNGNIVKAIICIRDITKEVNKDELIKIQKEKMETIIDNIYDYLVIFDENGNIKKLNSAIKYKNENLEYIKKTSDYYKYIEARDMDGNLISKENSIVARILKGEKITRCQYSIKVNNSNLYFELNGKPIYDEKGNFIEGILLIHDITDKLKSEESLLIKTQYETLRTLIENLELGFVRVSYPDNNIKYINNRVYIELMKIMPGIRMSSVLGKNVFDIFNSNTDRDTEMEDNLRNLCNKNMISTSYYRKYLAEGVEKYVKILCQPLLGINGSISEVIFIAMDMTEEVKAKNKIEKTLKIQDEIFANISHELKTPLNVIFSSNQLFELYLENNLLEANKDNISRNIKMIKQNCYRFTKLINNIVDISKIDSGFLKINLSNENIVSITEDIVQSVSEYVNRKNISIIFDTNIEEKIISCDPDKIERIMLNLISNAIKFTNTNGTIFVNVVDKGDTIEIIVRDTGIGIETKYLRNIFKRFNQVDKSLSRNAEGSGIGLSLVKSMVELHGGRISVNSKQGKGSIFKIELPGRIVENTKLVKESKSISSKIEMINIEFSDIYTI